MGAAARWKAPLRPAVFRLRRLAERARSMLVRPRPWDGRHHPVFARFPRWSGTSDGTWQHDFLGVRTDVRFRPQYRPDPPGPVAPPYPGPSAAYFEWIALLQSIVDSESDRPFVMFELGAGHGAWLAPAFAALRRFDPAREARQVGVEMDPQHFAWMRQHLKDNGVPDADARLIHGAVSDFDGSVAYRPEPDPSLRYGQSIGHRLPIGPRSGPTGAIRDEVAVAVVRLAPLLQEHDTIDLVHVDIQGEEIRVLRDAIGELRGRVRRLVVATHGRRRHRAARRLLAGDPWQIERNFAGGGLRRTPFGDHRFVDGLIVTRHRR